MPTAAKRRKAALRKPEVYTGVNEKVRERIREMHDDPEMLFADGLDDAVIGVVVRCGQPTLVCYDAEKCIQVLMKRDGGTYESASEFYYYNVEDAWVGPKTPVFLHRLPVEGE